MSEQLKPTATVLVVEDDDAVRGGLFWALNGYYNVIQASARDEAVEVINRDRVDVVVSDLHLPPHAEDLSEGLAIIETARRLQPPVPVVVITGSSSKNAGVEAVKRGAYGFFQKPIDTGELLLIVNQAARLRRLE